MRFVFDDFALDTDRRELRRGGVPIAVQPQVFDLITFLVANRDKVVSRNDLLEAVWHNRIVSESTLATRINAVRRALGDSGGTQRLVRTVHGRGFRFVGEVIEPPTHRDRRLASDGPNIAVLPLANLSADPALDSWAAGITENLIAALSNVPTLSVIAGNATNALERNRFDAHAVAGSFGVRYLLTGSIQGSERCLRVTVKLVDGAAGKCVWSDRYDCPFDDIFTRQDDIVRRVLMEICAKLTSGEHAHISGRGTHKLDAWLLHGQALEEWYRFECAANFRARSMYQRAHDADPKWSGPLAGLSATYREAAIRGWGGSLESNLEAAMELAKKAVALGPDDSTAHVHLANVRAQMGQIEEAVVIFEKAIELEPSDYFPLGAFAHFLPMVGEEMRALALFARSRNARPVPTGADLANEAFVLHLAGHRERAIEVLIESIGLSDIVDAHVRLAALYFECDRPQEARAEVTHVLTREPDATMGEYIGNLSFRDRQQRDRYKDLLRGAGLPDQF